MPVLSALFAIGFASIHVFIGKLRFLDVIPRSRWLSFAGGVAVAYVFLHVLPKLGAHQETLGNAGARNVNLGGERLIYLVALTGLAAFYGLERFLRSSRSWRADGAEASSSADPFWIHIGFFAVYNLLIGYLLLHREESGIGPLVVYFVAMSLHFVTNDFGLREDHRGRYDTIGRWVIAAAAVLGWLIGLTIEVPGPAVGLLFAFLAGGVVLNVLKEELPEERQSRFWPFALGAGAYALLLMSQ